MLRRLVQRDIQAVFSKVLSRILWPHGSPASAAAICVEGEEALLIRMGQIYDLPGGVVERGQTFREVREETGLEVEFVEEFGEFEESVAGHLRIFHVENVAGELAGSLEGEPVCAPTDDLPEMNWRFETGRKDVVNHLLEHQEP